MPRIKHSTSLPLPLPLDADTNLTTASNLATPHSSDFELVEFRYYSGLLPEKVLAKSIQLKMIFCNCLVPTLAASILPRNLIDLKMNQIQTGDYYKFQIHGN